MPFRSLGEKGQNKEPHPPRWGTPAGLNSERQYFESEIELARSQLNELLYIIKLYKALGGGWKQKDLQSSEASNKN